MNFFKAKYYVPILKLAISWLNLLRSMIFQMVDLKKKSQFGNVLLTAKLSQLRTSCTYKIIKYENNYLSICEYQGGVGIIF